MPTKKVMSMAHIAMLQGRCSVNNIHDYLSEIGRRGGQKSRRRLSSEDARAMVQKRWAKKKNVSTYYDDYYFSNTIYNTLNNMPSLRCGH
jgi:general stress protein YciG